MLLIKSALLINLFKTVIIVESSLFAPRHNTFYQPNFQKHTCGSLNANLTKNIHSAACKPRDTMVDVISDIANIMIFPNKIPVRRCGGGTCYGQTSCLPVETRIVKYAVRNHDFTTMKESCGVVEVEEHTRCKCQCSVMRNHCTSKQRYRPRECKCVCNNLEEREECLEQGRIWDSKECSCECAQDYSQCSTGTEWVPSKCQCMSFVNFGSNYDYDVDLPET